VAASYLIATSCTAGSAAEAAASRKKEKYAAISSNYLFFPLAFETVGPINRTIYTRRKREHGENSQNNDNNMDTIYILKDEFKKY